MKSYIEFRPKDVYPNLNFSLIKSRLILLTDKYEDYGSLLLLRYSNLAVSINDIGKVILYYDVYNKRKMIETLNVIEKAFQVEVEDFEINH